MKLIIIHRKTFFQAVVFCSLFFLSNVVLSEVAGTLYTGLTYSDNLEVQADTDIRGDQKSLTRSGVVTGVSLVQQSLDYRGGYTFQANASFNKDFVNHNDISRFLLSASRLAALNDQWLLRSTLSLNYDDNEAIKSSSHSGLLLQTTLGYLDKAGGGNDISLSLKQEQHDKITTETYDTTRSRLRLVHYFPHKKNEPYWTIDLAFKDNNASDNSRDYRSLMLGVDYRQWSFASFKGKVGFSWQQDRYDQSVLRSQNRTPMPISRPNGGIPETINVKGRQRNDNLYALSFYAEKPITASIYLQLSASLGVYDSTINNDSEDFYRLATQLMWRF